MTRVLLPILIAIFVILAGSILIPIAIRELRNLLFGGERAYELSKSLEDLPERNWER